MVNRRGDFLSLGLPSYDTMAKWPSGESKTAHALYIQPAAACKKLDRVDQPEFVEYLVFLGGSRVLLTRPPGKTD